MEPVIYENGIRYELRGEQYYPCFVLLEEDDTERELYERIVRQMADSLGIDDTLKQRNPMAWVGAMNNIRSAARELL